MKPYKSITGLFALALAASVPPLVHAEPAVQGTRITYPGESDYSQRVTLGLNKSMVVDLDQRASPAPL